MTETTKCLSCGKDANQHNDSQLTECFMRLHHD